MLYGTDFVLCLARLLAKTPAASIWCNVVLSNIQNHLLSLPVYLLKGTLSKMAP